MKRNAIPITMSVLTLAIILLPASVFGQDTPGVSGSGPGTFASGTIFSGVSLTAVKFGIGVFIPGDSTATGQFQATLSGTSGLGQPQDIELEGNAISGSNNADGSRTFSGTLTMDMGNGTPPLTSVPFTVTATRTSLVLVLGTTNLSATVAAGSITIY
jgi:hypothetical protein